jgi:hypothetical protein
MRLWRKLRQQDRVDALRDGLVRVTEISAADKFLTANRPAYPDEHLIHTAKIVADQVRMTLDRAVQKLPGGGESPVPSVDPAWVLVGGSDSHGMFVMAARTFGPEAPCEIAKLNLGTEDIPVPGSLRVPYGQRRPPVLRLPKVRNRLTLQFPEFTLVRGSSQFPEDWNELIVSVFKADPALRRLTGPVQSPRWMDDLPVSDSGYLGPEA